MKDERLLEALRGVVDPELGIDIVSLGLVYEAELVGSKARVVYSLTSMGCPIGPLIEYEIEAALRALPEVSEVEVELTFSPPWTPDLISEDARMGLGAW